MVIYKCTNGKKCSIARKKFGLTKKFACAGYILPDGEMIDLCFKKGQKEKSALWLDKFEHHQIGEAYGKGGSFDEMECFMKQCKAVRFRKQGKDGIIRIQSFTKPTSKQVETVKKAVDEGCSRFIGYAGEDLDPAHKSNPNKEATKKDVMKWVNKGW